MTQIGFLKIELLCESALLIGAASRGDDNYSFVAKKSARTAWSIIKRLPYPHNLIDPRLEGRRNREVVHRRANYDGVCCLQFFDQAIRGGQIIPLSRSHLRRFEECPAPMIGNVRQDGCREVSLYDLAIGVVLLPFLDELGCQLPGYRTGPGTGINLK